MSMLMDTLRQAEQAKPLTWADDLVQPDVQHGLGTHASLLSSLLPNSLSPSSLPGSSLPSSSLPSFSLPSSSLSSSSLSTSSLSKEGEGSLKDISGNYQPFSQIRQVQQEMPVKPTKHANNYNWRIVMGISCGVFFLLVFGAYAYYQSISNSLQKNISDAVSPVLNQQRQQRIKGVSVDPKSTTPLSELLSGKEAPQINRRVNKPPAPTSTLRSKQPAMKQWVSPAAQSVTKKSVPVIAGPDNAAPITIKRHFVADNIYQLLTNAYQAYQIGNDKQALSYYRNVLQLENNNRDALLGLAAISVRRNQLEKARDTYTVLLEHDPQDSVALSALINIQSRTDPAKSESKIKLLLHNEPGSPYLLFTLGSLYVAQQRWAEAQEVFFKAYSLDIRNADFAYNLAVSLDQLAQRKAALKFYRVALELVAQQPISFSVNKAMQRMNVLQAALAG